MAGPRRLPGTVVAAVALAAVTAAPTAAEPAPAEEPTTVRTVLTELRGLYQEVGAVTEAQRRTAARLRAQRARVDALHRELATTRAQLAETRQTVGVLAREQYRSALGLPASLRLLLSDNPARELRGQHVLDRAVNSQAVTLRALERGERLTSKLAREARAALDRRQSLARRQRRQEASVQEQLATIEELLTGLSGPQRSRLARGEDLVAARDGSGRTAPRVRPNLEAVRPDPPAAAGAAAGRPRAHRGA